MNIFFVIYDGISTNNNYLCKCFLTGVDSTRRDKGKGTYI